MPPRAAPSRACLPPRPALPPTPRRDVPVPQTPSEPLQNLTHVPHPRHPPRALPLPSSWRVWRHWRRRWLDASLGFRVWGLGFEVESLGFGVGGLGSGFWGFGVWSLGCRFESGASGFKNDGLHRYRTVHLLALSQSVGCRGTSLMRNRPTLGPIN